MWIISQCNNALINTNNITSIYIKTYDEKTYYLKAADAKNEVVFAVFHSKEEAQAKFNKISDVLASLDNPTVRFNV